MLTMTILLTVALTSDRPVLSSEKAPHIDRTVTFKEAEGARHQDRQND
jgi:hypothetical protein